MEFLVRIGVSLPPDTAADVLFRWMWVEVMSLATHPFEERGQAT